MDGDQGFRDAAATLFQEAFEGMPEGHDYTWFVDGKAGVFDALTSVDDVQASRKPSPDIASVAAHAYHLYFILQGANMIQGRPAPEGTWESTWEKQIVSPAEWEALIQRIQEEYSLFLGWLRTNTDWSHEDAYLNALTHLPHIAFHLGAIRQILRMVADDR